MDTAAAAAPAKAKSPLALLNDVVGRDNDKKLNQRTYNAMDALNGAAKTAFECGEVSESVDHLNEFFPCLSGLIGIKDREDRYVGQERYCLINKMLEGYASAGRIKTESGALSCIKALVPDSVWSALAEKAILTATVPLLQNSSDTLEFIYALKSDRAVLALMVMVKDAPPHK